MKKIIILLIFCVILFPVKYAYTTVINFDDLGIGQAVPAGYAGLTWGTSFINTQFGNKGIWVTNRPNDPSYATPHSPPIYSVNWWGGDEMSFGFSSPVLFNGAWFAAPNMPNHATQVRFYDNLGHVSNWLNIGSNPQYLSANFPGASTIWVERRGGVAADNGSLWFTMDDLTYNKPNFDNYYALLTGWSEIKGEDIQTEIDNFRSWLVNLGWEKDNIIERVGSSYSKNDILSEINNIATKIKPNSEFLFFYFGHGDTDFIGDESRIGLFFVKKNGEPIPMPYFYSGDESLYLQTDQHLYDDDLAAAFNTSAWKNVNKTFILNSCFSGGFWGGNDLFSFGDLERLSNTRLLAASQEDQLAGVNYFYNILSDALNSRLADLFKDGFITFQELQGYLGAIGGTNFVASNILGLDYDGLYDFDQKPQVFSNISFDENVFGVYNPVPEPTTMLLLGSGLLGLWGARKKFKK